MDAATSFLSPVLQVLARHRQPAAAIIDARMLSDLPGDADRIDLQALLEEGGSLTLTYDPGQSGACDDRGDVTDEPVDPAFVATALGWDGAVIGSGSGITIAEALLRIYRRLAASPLRAAASYNLASYKSATLSWVTRA